MSDSSPQRFERRGREKQRRRATWHAHKRNQSSNTLDSTRLSNAYITEMSSYDGANTITPPKRNNSKVADRSTPCRRPLPTAAHLVSPTAQSQAGTSSTYTSPSSAALARIQRLHNLASHINVSTSPFFPQNVQAYGEHQALYAADQAQEEKKRLENRMAAAAAVTVSLAERNLKGEEKEKEKMRMRVGKLMGGMFTERGIGMTAVLSMKSVWAPDYGLGSALGAHEVKEDQEDRLKDVQARVYWPAREELKSSGEALFRRNHPRRLPLPRLNKVRKINRSVMANSDRWANFLKMEKGEVAIPFRMKEIKKLEDWDRKCLTAVWDRKKWLTVDIQVIKDEDMIERGWLGTDLLAEL